MLLVRPKLLSRVVLRALVRDAILLINPTAEIDEFAPLRTEGAKLIVFPIGRFSASWTLHERRIATRFVQFANLRAGSTVAGRLISMRRLTKSIVPSRRIAFKRTVTLSLVEPTIEAISL